jgi:hypothetical protein
MSGLVEGDGGGVERTTMGVVAVGLGGTDDSCDVREVHNPQ